MGRHAKEREIGHLPKLNRFLPAAEEEPGREGSAVRLGLDELEALRLAHLEGLEQAMASRALGISRPTFGRILGAAHRKVTRALVEGLPLHIEGGEVVLDAGPRLCLRCTQVVPGEDMEDVVERRSPCCRAPTRLLREDEIDGLEPARLGLPGERLSLEQKRRYLHQAIRLASSVRTPTR